MNSNGIGAEKGEWGEVQNGELLLQEQAERVSFHQFTKGMLKGTMEQGSRHLEKKRNTETSMAHN